jgi:hypothetical protein
MGKSVIIACFAAVLIAAVAFAQSHSIDMGNTDCITCHSDPDIVSNPNIVSEWNKSIHSYSGVGCGTCHGDEKDFVARPRKNICESCHTDQIAVTVSPLPCERCHVPHTFNVHSK